MLLPELVYQTSLELAHAGDCSLLGVAPDLTVYVEEIYTEDCWIAQHAIRPDGKWLKSVDEHTGTNTNVQPLPLPNGTVKPQGGWAAMRLNFAGPRHKGMRIPERVMDMVKSVTVAEKMLLTEKLGLNVLPPMILGIAESFVVAEAKLQYPHLYVVCRRMRLAYALEDVLIGRDKHPYDYDTHIFYVAHLYDKEADGDEIRLDLALEGLPGVKLYRPMDCLITQEHLFIADGGGEAVDNPQKSRVHIWKINRSEGDTVTRIIRNYPARE